MKSAKSDIRAVEKAPKVKFPMGVKGSKPSGTGSGVVGTPRSTRLNPGQKTLDLGSVRKPSMDSSDRKRVGK